MATRKEPHNVPRDEPRNEPAEPSSRHESSEAMSLVDYFDQMDRDAFRRALEYRDSYFPIPADR
jgi:hypothetical protein